MAIKDVLVVYSNKKTKSHIECLEKLKEFLKNNFQGKTSFVDVEKLNFGSLNNVDLVISVGGDGTFVRASNFIKNQLIIGINSDSDTSEGALKSLFSNEIEKLGDILKGDYKVIQRQRAKVYLNGKEFDEHVLNVVFVGASSQFHSSRYILKHNSKVEEHRSSGILISTGTGSPAWFYSAGGKIFDFSDKKLKFVVREPYFGNRVYRPTILSGEIKDQEKIEVICTRESGSVLAVDDIVHELKKGDVVEVMLSEIPLNVIARPD